MVGEEVHQRLLGARGHDEEGAHAFGLAQVLAGYPLHRAADLHQRRGKRAGTAGQHRRAAIGGELAVARERLQQHEGDRVHEHGDNQHEQHPLLLFLVAPVAAAEAASEEQSELGDQRGERGEEAGQRHHHHVAVDHVCELVADHAFELGRVEHPQDAASRAHGRLLLRAAHRKGVGHGRVHHAHARLGQVRLHAQSLDDPMQLGLFLGSDLFGAERRERDLVRGEELHRQHEHRDHDDQAGGCAGGEEGADEHHVDESQQEHRQQHSCLQTAVFAEL